MHFSFPRTLQWLGVAAVLFVLVGLNYDFESEAGKIMNAPVEDSLSQSLLGYWKMDEGTGTSTTADASGNVTTLTMTAMESGDWVAGQIGAYSLDFDGSAEWLTVASPAGSVLDFADGRDFSVTGWFNRDTADTLDTIVAKRNGDAGGDTGYMVWLGTDDFLNFEVSDGVDQYAVASSTTYATAGWHQFVATWKDSLGMYLYVDGVLVGSTITSTSSIGSLSNAVPFRVAAESSTGTENPFDGKIDDVKLYSHALSANEVSRLYQTTVPGSPVDTGLVGHWTFDGNDVAWGDTSSEIKDVSGKGNHGDAAGSLSTTSVTPGKLGQGLSFNGTSDYVGMGNVLNIGDADDLTISAWVKCAGCGAWDTALLSKKSGYASSQVGYQALFWGSGELNFYVSDGTDQFELNASYNFSNSSEWHHVAIVWDQDGATNSKIYVDGIDNTSGRIGTIGDVGSPSNSLSLTIGARSDESETLFWGSLDDVRIYNRALPATEILNLYNLGK